MPNTALNRTVATRMQNKSGGAVSFGAVVIQTTGTDTAFTTTTTEGLSTAQVGVVLEPDGIANDAFGMVATAGWVPQINLDGAATRAQFIKTDGVAGQGTPHNNPQVEGDFAVALTASATPSAILFGSPNGAVGSGINQLTGDVTAGPGTGSQAATLATKYKTRVVTLTIDGNGSVPSTGIKTDVIIPVACTITAVRLLADQSGSCVIDIWKDTYANFPPTDADSITAAAPPTISGATKSEDTTLTGWTTAIAAGDTLRFNLDSIATITRVVMALEMTVA